MAITGAATLTSTPGPITEQTRAMATMGSSGVNGSARDSVGAIDPTVPPFLQELIFILRSSKSTLVASPITLLLDLCISLIAEHLVLQPAVVTSPPDW
jgi:hypothetical protein